MKIKLRKSLALLLAMLTALSVLSVTAMAADAEETREEKPVTAESDPQMNGAAPLAETASGTCGENLTWVLDDDGTLTISGTGEMTRYGSSSAPWYRYRSSIKSVVIEEGVTSISDYAFNYSDCTDVTLCDTLKSIGKYAFSASDITSINVPDSVTEIGDHAFSGCLDLQSATIGCGVTSISEYLFYECEGLKTAVISDGVTSIGDFAFYRAIYLEFLRLPASLTYIGDSAFHTCVRISDIYYGGTAADWAAIQMGENNSYLNDATFHYNFSGNISGRISVASLGIVPGGIEIRWDTDQNAEGYYIYRADGENGEYKRIQTVADGGTGSYIDPSVEDGVNYYYYVQAYIGNTAFDYETGKHITFLKNTVSDAAGISPEASNNRGDQNYSRWSAPVYSYLEKLDSGYMRVEYTGSVIAVEYYDRNFNITGKKYVTCELPLFGCFYAGEDAYYLVFGQSNGNEDDNAENFRIVKYTTDWERVGQISVYASATYQPFDAGSCRMTEAGGYLYVLTCKTGYAGQDGVHHQSDMLIQVEDFSAITKTGIASHSFNQFLLVDDSDTLIDAVHSDANPSRGVILTEYYGNATQGATPTGTSFDYTSTDVFSFQGQWGNNTTGASIGGLEYSSTSYLVAGNSVTQDDNWSSHTARNIFVTVTSRDNFSSGGTQIKWITDYDTDGSVSASTPQLVKLDSDSFLLLWTTTENSATKLHYVYLDGQGNPTSDIFTADGYLSDCQPIVSDNGSVIWYVTGQSTNIFFSSASVPTFYGIDPNGNLTTRSVTFTGFAQENGSWYYYVDGKITDATSIYYGTVNGVDGWYYVQGGRVNFSYTGLAQNESGWWYIENGTCNFNWTGLTQNEYGWWYVENSRCNFNWTGLVQNEYGWWYVENSRCNFNWTGLTQNAYGWWYVQDSHVSFDFTGPVQNEYGWWYIENSHCNFNFNGTAGGHTFVNSHAV